MTVFGLIGDVHAEDRHLETALAYFRRRGIATVLCTGDIVDGTGSVDRCIEQLARAGALTVAGNHDRWWLAGRMRDLPEATQGGALSRASEDYLRALPSSRELHTPEGSLLLCHGLGDDDMAGVKPDDYGYALETNDGLQALLRSTHRFVVNGHTHHPMVRSFGRLTIVNAGTLASECSPGFMVLDLAKRSVDHLDLDADGVRRRAVLPL